MHEVGFAGGQSEVRRRVVEDPHLQFLVAGELHGRVVRDVEPLVQIDADRVGGVDAVGEVRVFGGQRGEPAEGGVHVQPEAVPLLEAPRSPADRRSRPCSPCPRWPRPRPGGRPALRAPRPAVPRRRPPGRRAAPAPYAAGRGRCPGGRGPWGCWSAGCRRARRPGRARRRPPRTRGSPAGRPAIRGPGPARLCSTWSRPSRRRRCAPRPDRTAPAASPASPAPAPPPRNRPHAAAFWS